MIERPRQPGSPTCVSSIPESTSRSKETPKTEGKSDGRPRYPARLCSLFGGMGHPEGTVRRLDGVASLVCPVARFILERREPMAAR